MKRKIIAALLAGLCVNATIAIAATATASATAPAPAPKKIWITLGDEAYAQLRRVAPNVIARNSQSFATTHTPGTNAANTVTANTPTERVHVVEVNESTLFDLTEAVHHELRRCGGYIVHDSYEQAMRALQPVKPAVATLPSYAIDNQDIVTSLLPRLQDSMIASMIVEMSGFTNRYYTSTHGVSASNWLKNKWQTLAAGRSDITVEQITHPSWPQKSVMLTINGQTNPSEIIVIGAHLDSIRRDISMSENAFAPGADDDASGVATMTEVIRIMTAQGYKPNRTIKFIGYAAEEVGLRGSKEIAQAYKAQNANVIGVVQLDMTNYKGSPNDIYLFTDYTNAAQNEFLANLIRTYMPTVTIGQDRCGYGCSDHASWFNQGYVTSMPFEASFSGMNRYLHTANDTFATMGNQALHALKFAQLAMAYAVELGSDAASPPPPPPPPIDETYQGTVAQGQSVQYGPFKLRAGNRLTAQLTGTGDADLYLRRNAPPTRSSWDCRPYRGDSQETCTTSATTQDVDVYLMVDGYRSATYTLKVKSEPN